MRIGQTVLLFSRQAGKYQSATLLAIVGAGESGYKLLQVEESDKAKEVFDTVPHWKDAKGCDVFWMLTTEDEPKSWKKVRKASTKTKADK